MNQSNRACFSCPLESGRCFSLCCESWSFPCFVESQSPWAYMLWYQLFYTDQRQKTKQLFFQSLMSSELNSLFLCCFLLHLSFSSFFSRPSAEGSDNWLIKIVICDLPQLSEIFVLIVFPFKLVNRSLPFGFLHFLLLNPIFLWYSLFLDKRVIWIFKNCPSKNIWHESTISIRKSPSENIWHESAISIRKSPDRTCKSP